MKSMIIHSYYYSYPLQILIRPLRDDGYEVDFQHQHQPDWLQGNANQWAPFPAH